MKQVFEVKELKALVVQYRLKGLNFVKVFEERKMASK